MTARARWAIAIGVGGLLLWKLGGAPVLRRRRLGSGLHGTELNNGNFLHEDASGRQFCTGPRGESLPMSSCAGVGSVFDDEPV